jgi:uncharacterized protein
VNCSSPIAWSGYILGQLERKNMKVMQQSARIRTILDQFVFHLRTFPSVQEVILFGSRAKGTATPYSDIDIAVTGVEDEREWTHILQLADVDDDHIVTLLKIDLVQFEHLDTAIQRSILNEGQVLYER